MSVDVQQPVRGNNPAQPAQPRKRRGVELVLLVLAFGIVVAGYCITELAYNEEISTDLIPQGITLAVLVTAAHLLVRFVAPYADPLILPIAALLNGIGLVLMHRLDLGAIRRAEQLGAEDQPSPIITNQLMWTVIGVVLFLVVVTFLKDHRWLQRLTYTSGLAGVVLLLMPLVPVLGVSKGGARIWISLGPFSFQPGEAAKLCLIVFFAGYLVLKRDALALAGRRFLGMDLPRGRDLGPILIAWMFAMAILVFQRDFGTGLLFYGSFVILLYVATERRGWAVVGGGLFVGGVTAIYLLATTFNIDKLSHILVRVDAWLNPFADPEGPAGYQILQGLYAFAYGGILGQGLGQGYSDSIPVVKSDYIMAVVGEDLGLTGMMALLLLYGLLVERAVRTALMCRDTFGKLLSIGFAALFAIQVFIVVGGVTKLIPLTGLTTPFLSQGGSSLVINWILVALLIRISDQARRPAPVLPPPTDNAETQVVSKR